MSGYGGCRFYEEPGFEALAGCRSKVTEMSLSTAAECCRRGID